MTRTAMKQLVNAVSCIMIFTHTSKVQVSVIVSIINKVLVKDRVSYANEA